jgi:hypothetical protein
MLDRTNVEDHEADKKIIKDNLMDELAKGKRSLVFENGL